MNTTKRKKYKEKHREYLNQQLDAFLKSGNKVEKDINVEKKRHQRYIKSTNWEKRKKEYYKRFFINSCEVCLSKKAIQVHHNNYVNAKEGQEQDSHLVVLCGDCHRFFHQHSKPISYVMLEYSSFSSKSGREPVQKCCKLCGQKARYDVKTNFFDNQKFNENLKKYNDYLVAINRCHKEAQQKINDLKKDADYLSSSKLKRRKIRQKLKNTSHILKVEKPAARKGLFMCAPCTLIFKEQLNQNNNGEGTSAIDLINNVPMIFKEQPRKPSVVRRRKTS